jgi:hypothetical protein
MADWKSLAMKALLSDGRIDTKETNLVKEAIFADDKIDKSELEFVFQLRKKAQSTVKVFDEMFFDAVKSHVLADGDISDAEVKWLKRMILADEQVDEGEKQLLRDLKAKARSTTEAFDSLCSEVLGE